MTNRHDFDMRLASWFDEAAIGATPDGLLDAVLASTSRRRSRPAWIVALRGGDMRPTIRVAGQPIRRLAYLALLAILLVAAAAAVLLAGGSSRPLGANGAIAFVRTDATRSTNSGFVIDPGGSHEGGIAGGMGGWSGIAGWSPDGTKLLVAVGDTWARPAVVDLDGSNLRVLDAYPGRMMHLAPRGWSPDGSRILIESGPLALDPADVGLYTVRSSDGADLRRLTVTPAGSWETPSGYSPDGSRILFARHDQGGLFVVNADGTGLRQLTPENWVVVDLEFWDWAEADWSRDGSQAAFALRGNPAGSSGLYLVRLDGTAPRQLVGPDIGALSVRWSPSNDRIAFTGGHVGPGRTPAGKELVAPQIWVINADGTGRMQLTDGTDGSTSVTPVWSPDGTKLLFQRKLDDQVTLWTMNADGTDQTQVTATPVAADYVGEYAWAPPISH
jgi:Tol biopolymer transport system component